MPSGSSRKLLSGIRQRERARPHHDQVGAFLLRLIEDHRRGFASALDGLRLDAALFQDCGRLGQLALPLLMLFGHEHGRCATDGRQDFGDADDGDRVAPTREARRLEH